MNALDRNFVTVGQGRSTARFLGGAAAVVLLAGCAGPIASTKVDPQSPIAADVAKLATADKDYPSFREIPPKPTGLPPTRIYAERAQALETARDNVDAATAAGTWSLENSAAFAERAQAAAGPDYTPPAATDTEAFVRTSRKRATPPPPRR